MALMRRIVPLPQIQTLIPGDRAMSGFKTLVGSVFLAATLSACATNTMPSAAAPADPIRHNRLEVPAWLEILSIDFAAAMRGGGDVSTERRGFYSVFGRHRETDKYYLLLYEDITRRVAPIEIVEVDTTVVSDWIGESEGLNEDAVTQPKRSP
jgi:hypothetical protein